MLQLLNRRERRARLLLSRRLSIEEKIPELAGNKTSVFKSVG
jgi:hypothetical protein